MYLNDINRKPAITVVDLAEMKRGGKKITCLTAYDASFASILDQSGIDVLLVGDSLGSVMQGQQTTVPVTVESMVYHTRCVSRGRTRSLVIADMPFCSYANESQAVINAARLMQQGNAQMVKLEGGRQRAETVAKLVAEGIPVCGHLGLQPQSIHRLGGYHVQGSDDKSAQMILEDALIIQESGISLLVLECVPAELAKEITQNLTIPTIGIGAGVDCDGQVLVLYDMLGISIGKRPRFSKNFMEEADSIENAVKAYDLAVRNSSFPGKQHSF